MECHRCKHRAALAAGKYREVAFEQTPCARCELRIREGYEVPFLEDREPTDDDVDEGDPTVESKYRANWRDYATMDRHFFDEPEEDEPVMPVAVMREAIARLLMLDPKTRDVICMRYAGVRYHEIARRLGVTVAAAEVRHRRALERWAPLKALFPEKTAKQRRRKPHRRPAAVAGVATGVK